MTTTIIIEFQKKRFTFTYVKVVQKNVSSACKSP